MGDGGKRPTVRDVLAALDHWVEQQAEVTALLWEQAAAERKAGPDDGPSDPGR